MAFVLWYLMDRKCCCPDPLEYVNGKPGLMHLFEGEGGSDFKDIMAETWKSLVMRETLKSSNPFNKPVIPPKINNRRPAAGIVKEKLKSDVNPFSKSKKKK